MAMMRLAISTRGQGLYEFTQSVREFLRESAAEEEGVMTVFVRHTSCSLLIQENADPLVQTDLKAFFRRLVPPTTDPAMDFITHRDEGPDDMPAHIKAALLPVSLSVPFADRRLLLGTWQGIYLFEHRDSPHRREVVLHV
ncbi:secondary thiamine-phosphate synthase [Rhizobium sp. TH135]|uniref:secondary thiamine-phosphate synthase enzyme YjbQ n=1 Tax=Rhizobium sp. TH135 TaxID=2067451 RepID=UPI000C7A510F|nr:secondary thiamine-phosphate synthase enzyme YjbQ [Rhizobium sp. TH135]PLK72274.1 secondary thiamine-phosphate synthase [Rhizobium sp. TH135]